MNVNQFNNMSPQQIVARIEELKESGLDSVRAICVCLLELRRRSLTHPLHKDKIYRWFEPIASGKLHPGLVGLFNGNRSHLDHIVGRQMDLQNGMVAGIEYPVAIAVKGEIVEKRQSVTKMALKTFQRAFPKDVSPATISEQRAALAAELESAPKTHVRSDPIIKADSAKETLTIGRQTVPITAIKAALAEIGLEIQRAGNTGESLV